MKLKSVIVVLLSVAIFLALATGCATNNDNSSTDQTGGNANQSTGDTSNSNDQPEDVTLRMSWWGGDSRHAATQAAVEAFMEKYPYITVEMEFGAWSGWEESVANQVMSKTTPDVMQVNWNWLTAYSSDGSAFYDLNELSDVIDLTQWNESQLAQCTVADELQGIPVAITGRIFYWNEDTYASAGLEVPTTFDELVAAGEVFKTQLGEDYYPLVMGEYDRMIFMVYYLESVYGMDWVVDNEVQYTAEQIQEGIDMITYLEDNHVIPTIQTLIGDGADSLDKNQNWIDGHYAGIFEWDSAATKFKKAAPDSNIVIGNHFADIGDYQGGYTKVSLTFAISEHTEYPEESALLINYLLNEEEGIKLMASERGVPASKTALEVLSSADLLDSFVADANEKVVNWCSFALDPYFEDNALKSNPDGAYYKLFSNVSYDVMSSAEGAEYLLEEVNDLLSN